MFFSYTSPLNFLPYNSKHNKKDGLPALQTVHLSIPFYLIRYNTFHPHLCLCLNTHQPVF